MSPTPDLKMLGHPGYCKVDDTEGVEHVFEVGIFRPWHFWIGET